MTVPLEVGGSVSQPEDVLLGATQIEGRSLGQIAWRRLKRDKVALAGGAVLVLLILVAIFAPLIVKLLGHPPNEFHQDLIDTPNGTLGPKGPLGGHELGVPVRGGAGQRARPVQPGGLRRRGSRC